MGGIETGILLRGLWVLPDNKQVAGALLGLTQHVLQADHFHLCGVESFPNALFLATIGHVADLLALLFHLSHRHPLTSSEPKPALFPRLLSGKQEEDLVDFGAEQAIHGPLKRLSRL